MVSKMIEIANKCSKIALKLRKMAFGRWIDRNLCIFKEFYCHINGKYYQYIENK